MHRRIDLVAGQRRLHRDLGGLGVAHFAHHDAVRVVAQDRAQAAREGQALGLVDRDLQHVGQLVFDRVLDGDHLVLAGVDLRQHAVQRGGLARAGRAGDEQQAVGHLREPADEGSGVSVEAEVVDRQCLVGRELVAVEDPQHRVLAVAAGHDRDPHVDLAAGTRQFQAAVLRHAALGDVEVGQHLQARDHAVGELLALGAADALQHAVEPVLDDQAARAAFEVDVAGLGLQRVVERAVEETHHGALVGADLRQREFERAAVAAGAVADTAGLGLQGAGLAFEAGVEGLHVAGGGYIPARARVAGLAQARLDPQPDAAVERVGQHQVDGVVGTPQGHAQTALALGERDDAEVGQFRACLAQVAQQHAAGFTEPASESRFAHRRVGLRTDLGFGLEAF